MATARADGPAGRRRFAVMALVLAAFVAVAGWYAAASANLLLVGRDRADDLLGPTDRPVAERGDPGRLLAGRRALRDDPLDQAALNAVIVEQSRATGRRPSKAAFNLLLRLGWRDPASLQNVAEYYANGEDIGRLVDIFDALLRLQRMTGPVGAVLLTMEADRVYHPALLAKLRADPPWRGLFLQLSASELATPHAVDSRVRTLRELRRSPHPPGDAEIAALLPPLIQGGRAADALDLWSAVRRSLSRPLNDPDFSQAAILASTKGTVSAFDWQFGSGDGFGATVATSAPALAIEWGGMGVPVFASQRTSAQPGRYRLEVTRDEDGDATDAPAVGYRLVCAEASSAFVATGSAGGATDRYRLTQPVGCAFPRFEIYGTVQDRPRDVRTTIRRLVLRRAEMP